ncbi:HK97-gp10 family putative phage morphogenesis protein [Desulfosporosinus sp. OT]|uniref:HK97-gp10 family putative phage morphogenesis protein n=1 Tax=Desulfosporosinus sp. OT TaxID=913865 RepID=UPI00058BE749|nr:HK97-gp10 family putative phage morphogenesis protein [Desulfosporosinus sp. OT]
MPLPRSVTKITRDGVQFTSNVDRTKYLLVELQRAALRDTAKLIRKKMVAKLRKLPGMKRSKRPYSSTQYWVRKRETDLQIGFKHDTWYGVLQELGTKGQPARNILRGTVMDNIDDIRRVQGKYLSAIESENVALGLIDLDGNAFYGDGDDEE